MKTINFSILIVFFIAFLSFGCDEDKSNQLIPKGVIVKHSACKTGQKSPIQRTTTPDSLSCIDYLFDDSNNKLTLKHVNAGFNCCPDSLYCNVSMSNDTIIIQEFEKSQNCKCNCLYDLDIEINGVGSKKYQVRFIEPYCGEQNKIIFGLDLTKDKNGSYCFTRKHYPWSAD